MDISQEQCKQFEQNPTVNPLTGRKIELGKVRHVQLKKACSKLTTAKTIPKNAVSAKKTSSKEAPSFGPMIYWKFNTRDTLKIHANIRIFVDYIRSKIHEYYDDKTIVISKMELDEFLEILKDLKDYVEDENFEGREKFLKRIKNLILGAKDILKTHKFTDDAPKRDVFEKMELRPDRLFNRGQVLFIYNYFMSTKHTFETAIKYDKIFSHEGEGTMRRIREMKKYLDHLIKLKVFRYDDIYHKMFDSEKNYNALFELYKKYKVIYKRTEGKSL